MDFTDFAVGAGLMGGGVEDGDGVAGEGGAAGGVGGAVVIGAGWGPVGFAVAMRVASARPYPGRKAAGSKPQGAKRLAKRSRVAGRMRSAPQGAAIQEERSRFSISSSRMNLAQASNALLGAPLKLAWKRLMVWSQRAGFWMKSCGEKTMSGKPASKAWRYLRTRPMSCCGGSHETPQRMGCEEFAERAAKWERRWW
jgi:hypothetical protein